MHRYVSKTVATWTALVGGGFGLHRFYLNGPRDTWAWLHPWPTLVGLYGVWRMRTFGLDDHLGWFLVPFGGLTVAQSMVFAIVYALTPDERWDATHNPGGTVHATRWAPVIGAALALALGTIVLMSTIAFSGEKYFQYQVEEAHRESE